MTNKIYRYWIKYTDHAKHRTGYKVVYAKTDVIAKAKFQNDTGRIDGVIVKAEAAKRKTRKHIYVI